MNLLSEACSNKLRIPIFGTCGPNTSCCATGSPAASDDTDSRAQVEAHKAAESAGGEPLRSLLSFDASLAQPVEGRLIRQGSLLMLDGKDNTMKPWTVLVFSNGFYAVSQSPRQDGNSGDGMHSFAWSPFTEVRELTSDPKDASCPFRDMSAFALYLFGQSMGFVFATWGASAGKERHQWVQTLTDALEAFTFSLFPPFSIAAYPLANLPTTRTRVVAGYLLQDHSGSVVSVPYCELHAHCHNSALFAMYEAESCERIDSIIPLTAATPICDSRGPTCPCFSFDTLQLCARTVKEKYLWLRALENIQVKILNEAPNPSSEELDQWREAVLDSAAQIVPSEEWVAHASMSSRSPGRSRPSSQDNRHSGLPAQTRHRHRVHQPSPGRRPRATGRADAKTDCLAADTQSTRSHDSLAQATDTSHGSAQLMQRAALTQRQELAGLTSQMHASTAAPSSEMSRSALPPIRPLNASGCEESEVALPITTPSPSTSPLHMNTAQRWIRGNQPPRIAAMPSSWPSADASPLPLEHPRTRHERPESSRLKAAHADDDVPPDLGFAEEVTVIRSNFDDWV